MTNVFIPDLDISYNFVKKHDIFDIFLSKSAFLF